MDLLLAKTNVLVFPLRITKRRFVHELERGPTRIFEQVRPRLPLQWTWARAATQHADATGNDARPGCDLVVVLWSVCGE